MTPSASDAALWRKSCEGDTKAFEALVRRHQNLVCAMTFSAVGDETLSEDLAQEVFLAAWRSLGELREPNRIRAWLVGIARNVGLNFLRSAPREQALPTEADIDSSTPSPEEIIADREPSRMVWQALEPIPATYREPMVLYYREGRSTREVADALGLRVSAVEQRLSRGRKQLKRGVERMVERTLARGRPRRGFAAAVVAALPARTAPVTNTDQLDEPTVPTAVDKGRWSMHTTIISGTVLLALGGFGIGHVVSSGDTPISTSSPAAAATNGRQTKTSSPEPVAVPSLAADAAASDSPSPLETSKIHYRLTVYEPGHVMVNLEGGLTPLVRGPKYQAIRKATGERRLLEGQVFDADGSSVEGAVVVAATTLMATQGGSLAGHAGATTDRNGRFAMEISAESTTGVVAMHRDGWSTVMSIKASPNDTAVDLHLEPPARLEGTLFRGAEATDGAISVELADSRRFQYELKTESSGHYVIPVLPPGSYNLFASSDRDGTGRLGSGARAQTTLNLPSGGTSHWNAQFSSGGFIALAVDRPPDADDTLISFWVVSGEHTFADLAALKAHLHAVPAEQQRRSVRTDESMVTFEDFPSGPVTGCAQVYVSGPPSVGSQQIPAKSDGFACATGVLTDAAEDLDLRIVPPDARGSQ